MGHRPPRDFLSFPVLLTEVLLLYDAGVLYVTIAVILLVAAGLGFDDLRDRPYDTSSIHMVRGTVSRFA